MNKHIKTISGRQYFYSTVRIPGKKNPVSVYHGPVGCECHRLDEFRCGLCWAARCPCSVSA